MARSRYLPDRGLTARMGLTMFLLGLLYVAPALAFFAVFGIWPFLQTILISFTRWRGIGEQVPVGLDNYADVLRDEDLSMGFVRAGVPMLAYESLNRQP